MALINFFKKKTTSEGIPEEKKFPRGYLTSKEVELLNLLNLSIQGHLSESKIQGKLVAVGSAIYYLGTPELDTYNDIDLKLLLMEPQNLNVDIFKLQLGMFCKSYELSLESYEFQQGHNFILDGEGIKPLHLFYTPKESLESFVNYVESEMVSDYRFI